MSYEFARSGLVRKALRFIAWAALVGAVAIACMYYNAKADPVVRSTQVAIPNLTKPIRLVLMSDVHVAGPDMPPSRVARIVEKVNALHPDIILIAGDFVSDKRTASRFYTAADAITPLTHLRSRLGTYAVLGNHDYWRDASAVTSQLRRASIRVLTNDAVSVGPLAIGGVDDPFTAHDDLKATIDRLRKYPEPRVLLSHSPDVFPRVPSDIVLTMAGHTHCGQIRIPGIGALSTMSAYGEKYACGRVDEGGRTLIVSAGLGTSLLPLRLGAPPDIWLVELRSAAR